MKCSFSTYIEGESNLREVSSPIDLICTIGSKPVVEEVQLSEAMAI